jgi:hypothetical protein
VFVAAMGVPLRPSGPGATDQYNPHQIVGRE